MVHLRRKQVGVIAGILAVLVVAAGAATYIVLRNQDNADPLMPVVNVAQGTVQGQWITLRDSKDAERYASFRGIPYAQPPIGALRFKAPRSPSQWTEVWDASEDKADCVQFGLTGMSGSEDCLYLNVYTPRLPKHLKTLLPVYLFVHGGTFMTGTGNFSWVGPEFLMHQNVVVVTIKYRVDVFGFLNLDTEVVPGNAGMKDQVAALKWVHQNVAQFGGNPDRITVGGQSAGAVSAHWLSLLPESRDLINGVILESGSALHSFGYNEENFDVALDLGRRLTNKAVTIEDVSQLVMTLSPEDIMTASNIMATERMTTRATEIPFAPSPERRAPVENGEYRLITQSPETYIIDTSVVPKPMFVGMNSREWLANYAIYGYPNNPEMMYDKIEHLIHLLPKNIIPYPDTIAFLNLTDAAVSYSWSDVTDAVGRFYFQRNDTSCNLTCTFKRYLDDIVIGEDTNRLVELRARAKLSTTYVYRFAVRDVYSLSPFVDPEQKPDGAVHNDELGYIWKISPPLRQKLKGDGLASRTLRRMTNMWGSFISTGVPSPKEGFEGNWQPAEKRKNKIIYLNIGEELNVIEDDIAGPNMPFWFDLYTKYRGGKST